MQKRVYLILVLVLLNVLLLLGYYTIKIPQLSPELVHDIQHICNDPEPTCEGAGNSGAPLEKNQQEKLDKISCKERAACQTYKIICDPCKSEESMVITTIETNLFSLIKNPKKECYLKMNPATAQKLGFQCQCDSPKVASTRITDEGLKEVIETDSFDENAILRCILAHEREHAEHTCEIAESSDYFFRPYSCTTEEYASRAELKCLDKVYNEYCKEDSETPANIDETTARELCLEIAKERVNVKATIETQSCLCNKQNPSDGIDGKECKECVEKFFRGVSITKKDQVAFCSGYCRKTAGDPVTIDCERLFE